MKLTTHDYIGLICAIVALVVGLSNGVLDAVFSATYPAIFIIGAAGIRIAQGLALAALVLIGYWAGFGVAWLMLGCPWCRVA